MRLSWGWGLLTTSTTLPAKQICVQSVDLAFGDAGNKFLATNSTNFHK